MNCRASMRPFRASRMNLLFLFLLAVSFFLSMIVIGYTIMSSDVWVTILKCQSCWCSERPYKPVDTPQMIHLIKCKLFLIRIKKTLIQICVSFNSFVSQLVTEMPWFRGHAFWSINLALTFFSEMTLIAASL